MDRVGARQGESNGKGIGMNARNTGHAGSEWQRGARGGKRDGRQDMEGTRTCGPIDVQTKRERAREGEQRRACLHACVRERASERCARVQEWRD